LFEGGFEIFDDFLGKYIGIGEIVGFFKGFVSAPEDTEAGFVAVEKPACPHFSLPTLYACSFFNSYCMAQPKNRPIPFSPTCYLLLDHTLQ
jgi:hypothetical protein